MNDNDDIETTNNESSDDDLWPLGCLIVVVCMTLACVTIAFGIWAIRWFITH